MFAEMRIQMSQDCKALLDRLGKFYTEERGEVEVKVCYFYFN